MKMRDCHDPEFPDGVIPTFQGLAVGLKVVDRCAAPTPVQSNLGVQLSPQIRFTCTSLGPSTQAAMTKKAARKALARKKSVKKVAGKSSAKRARAKSVKSPSISQKKSQDVNSIDAALAKM